MTYIFIAGIFQEFKAGTGESRLNDTDLGKMQKLFLKNILAAIPTRDDIKSGIVSNSLFEIRYPDTDAETHSYHLPVNFNGTADALKNLTESVDTKDFLIFINGTILGIHPSTFTKMISFLEIDEEFCCYVTDDSGMVVMIGANKFDPFFFNFDFTSAIPEEVFLSHSLRSNLRVDKLMLKDKLFTPSNLTHLQNYVSDRNREPLNDPSLYKDFNLLFIEHKPLMVS